MRGNFLKNFILWVNGDDFLDKIEEVEIATPNVLDVGKIVKNKVYKPEVRAKLYRILCVMVCFIFIGVLLVTVQALPEYGSENNPTSNEVVKRYIEKGTEETGALNIVAAMILDYRAFDTFGESAVLFLAVICVVMLLKRDENNITFEDDREMAEDDEFFILEKYMVLKQVARVIVPMIFLYGIYVVLNGHLSPGGGFSGGAIIGSGLILYSTAYGFHKIHSFFTFSTFTRISVACMITYCAAKGYSFFTGANHLHSIIQKGTPGDILSGGLILPLNICVGMVVACTMYGFYALFTKGDI